MTHFFSLTLLFSVGLSIDKKGKKGGTEKDIIGKQISGSLRMQATFPPKQCGTNQCSCNQSCIRMNWYTKVAREIHYFPNCQSFIITVFFEYAPAPYPF